jgi:hypothetical protein
MASLLATKRLDEISDSFPVSLDNPEPLIETAMTTLGSKMSVIFQVITRHDGREGWLYWGWWTSREIGKGTKEPFTHRQHDVDLKQFTK